MIGSHHVDAIWFYIRHHHLTLSFLLSCEVYVHHHDATSNPEISPAFASHDLLANFPPTKIMVGGMDPLLDDTVDFHTRLRKAACNVEIHISRGLPHGFWSLVDWLPEAHDAMNLAIEWIIDGCAGCNE